MIDDMERNKVEEVDREYWKGDSNINKMFRKGFREDTCEQT